MDSILNSIKQLLGVSEEYHQFDANIIMQINSVFLTLNQLGVGPDEVFEIQDEYEDGETSLMILELLTL